MNELAADQAPASTAAFGKSACVAFAAGSPKRHVVLLLLALANLWSQSAFIGHIFAQQPKEPSPTLADLDPERARLFLEAREELRQVKQQVEEAERQAEAANPTLAVARRLEVECRRLEGETRYEIAILRQEYERRGPADSQKFDQWSACRASRAGRQRFSQLARDKQERPLAVWYAAVQLQQFAVNPAGLPDNVRSLLPANVGQLPEEESLRVFRLLLDRLAMTVDCDRLEQELSPSDRARDVVDQFGRAGSVLPIAATYAATHIPDTLKAERSRLKEPLARVGKIWPAWADFERSQAWNAQVEKQIAMRQAEFSKRGPVEKALLLLTAMVGMVLVSFYIVRFLRTRPRIVRD